MLSKVNTLINGTSSMFHNVGYGEELDNDLRSSFANSRNTIQEEYINQCSCDFVNGKMRILNRKRGKFLTRLYGNNEKFREEIINFVRDKKELDLELISDKRCITNTLNTLGNKYLAEFMTSKDNTNVLIEIMAKYYPRSGYTDGETSAKQFH